MKPRFENSARVSFWICATNNSWAALQPPIFVMTVSDMPAILEVEKLKDKQIEDVHDMVTLPSTIPAGAQTIAQDDSSCVVFWHAQRSDRSRRRHSHCSVAVDRRQPWRRAGPDAQGFAASLDQLVVSIPSCLAPFEFLSNNAFGVSGDLCLTSERSGY